MSGFRLLDGATHDGRLAWLESWHGWPGREIFAHPDYAALYADPGDRVVCASWSGDGSILLPLLLRPLRREAWAAQSSGDWDATTPYGYGGAFSLNASAADTAAFWANFMAWAADASVVTVFARLSLFDDQLVPFHGEIIESGPNVVRSLQVEDDPLWRDYAHKVRKNVTRARAAGLRVEVDETGRRLGDFEMIYQETLRRRNAAPRYYFPESFFEAIRERLNGQFTFFHVLDGERVVSSELVLLSARHLYSFLGGTSEDAFVLRPNDLLKHEIIRWGRNTGRESFVLGGGFEPLDGVFTYKLAFAPRGQLPFRTGRLIVDHQRYAKLVEWRFRDGKHVVSEPGAAQFFPAYRA